MKVDHKTKPIITGAEIHLCGGEELHRMRVILDYYFDGHQGVIKDKYHTFAESIYKRLCVDVE